MVDRSKKPAPRVIRGSENFPTMSPQNMIEQQKPQPKDKDSSKSSEGTDGKTE